MPVLTVNSYELRSQLLTSNVRGIVRLFCSGGWVVTIQFRAQPPAPPQFSSNNVLAFENIEAYARIVDMLRNEKPVSILVNAEPASPTLSLFTGQEPVGDGEV